jgi:hypothetical protein
MCVSFVYSKKHLDNLDKATWLCKSLFTVFLLPGYHQSSHNAVSPTTLQAQHIGSHFITQNKTVQFNRTMINVSEGIFSTAERKMHDKMQNTN